MKKWVKWTVVSAVVLGGVVGGGWWAWERWGTGMVGEGAGGNSAAVEVKGEVVEAGELSETVSAPGQIEPLMAVQISAKISAVITELPFDEGQAVKKGDVLVRMDASDLAASLKAAEARFAAQKASMEVAEVRLRGRRSDLDASRVLFADAERDFRRQRRLLESGDVSEVVMEAAQVKVDQLRNQLESAERGLEADRAQLAVMRFELEAGEAQITQAREQLSYSVITSPIDGTVTRLNGKVGELAMTGTMNNAGTVILEVADLSRMLVVARVDESAIANLRPGLRAVTRSPAYPGREFKGVVRTVALSKTSASMAGSRGQASDGIPFFRTEILLDPVEKERNLRGGVSADVEMETKLHQGVLRVPSQAVMGRGVDEIPEAGIEGGAEVDRTKAFVAVVFVVKDGKARVRPVKAGASDLTHTLVERGLTAGETVVTGPFKVLATLSDGTAVKLLPPTTRPAAATTGPATTRASADAK